MARAFKGTAAFQKMMEAFLIRKPVGEMLFRHTGRSEMTLLVLGHLILYFSLALLHLYCSLCGSVLGRSLLMEEFFESGCKNRGFLITLVTFHCCSTYPDHGL